MASFRDQLWHECLHLPSMVLTFVLLATATLILTRIVFIIKKENNQRAKQLPSPWKLPIIGNFHQLGAHAHRSLRDIAVKHGPLMLVHLGSIPYLVVSTADAAREVLKTHDLAFSSRSSGFASRMLLYDSKDVATAPYGEYWRQARKICVLHLLTVSRLRLTRWIREEEVGRMLKKIEQSVGEPFNVSQALWEITNTVTGRVTLGRSYADFCTTDGDGRSIRAALAELLQLLSAFNVADFSPWLAWVSKINGFNVRVRRNAKELDDFLERIVDEHIRNREANIADGGSASGDTGGTDGGSFVDVLLSVQQSGQYDSMFDRNSIKGVILDMFSAGTHTVSMVMDWTMVQLVKHPKVKDKLKQEIRKVCPFKKDIINEDDIEKMTYLRSVVKEVLRLHPPLPLLVPRETIDDVHLNGYQIPKGMRVMINAWAISMDPNIWENPEIFWPERFIDNKVDFKGLDFELIPFGAGRRGCPGIIFASQLVELVVANLMNRFEWELPEGLSPEDLDMTEASGLTTTRKFSLTLRARTITKS